MTVPSNFRDAWYYPPDISHDLDECIQLSEAQRQEAYACGWEYARCVIPQYTNWKRYVSFIRIVVMSIFAEFRGDLVDITVGDNILGYSVDGLLADLFGGTQAHEMMARELKAFLLITAEKSSERRGSELFRRYVNALASSPRTWFRMRDCDALARFTMAAALACNDIDDVLPTEDEFELLGEMSVSLYDSVSFYKHRSEGETNSTFAYVPQELRIETFRIARELLWALDVAYASRPEGPILMNFVRFFGGPLHMMMRRYRFVEDECTIGRPETNDIIVQARHKVKLWNRVEVDSQQTENQGSHYCEVSGLDRYEAVLACSKELMFPELPKYLEQGGYPQHCDRCIYRSSYGAEKNHSFGGVSLCRECSSLWCS